MDDSRIKLLRDSSIKEAVNKMAFPAIVGLMVMAIYNIVDTMFVSWISTEATAATQVVFPLMIIASAIGLMFGIGGGSYLSRLLGEKKLVEAEKVASTSFFSGLFIGIIVTIFNYIFMKEIFAFFGANEAIMSLTVDYGKYIIIGYSFSILNMVLNNLLRSEGSGKLSMVGMLAGAVLNIILDPIFIFAFDLGIAGAAIATTLSQIVSFVILFSAFVKKKALVSIKWTSVSFKWNFYKEILKIGIPTFVKQVLVSFSVAFLNDAALRYGGNDLLATIGIIIKVTLLPMNIVFGFGQGFQPVAGYNFGAKNNKRVLDAFKYTLIISTIVMIITSIIFATCGKAIFGIFNASESVTALGVKGLRFYSIGLLFLGIINTTTVFYQAMGKGLEATILSVSRQGIFFIPTILILPKFIGENGVFLTQTVADILTLIVSIILIILYKIKYKEELSSNSEENVVLVAK